jgi:hypothetical protein
MKYNIKIWVSVVLALTTALSVGGAAFAQGQNKETIVKPNRAVACPSGWKTPDGDTSLCAPQGSIAPKIYAKKEKESCADGYYEVYRVWCSTKRP